MTVTVSEFAVIVLVLMIAGAVVSCNSWLLLL